MWKPRYVMANLKIARTLGVVLYGRLFFGGGSTPVETQDMVARFGADLEATG
jgi:hypothetical protein